MHHIATVIYPSAPAPTVEELIAFVSREVADARVGEAPDGLVIRIEAGVIYAEVEETASQQLLEGELAGERTIEDTEQPDDDDEAAPAPARKHAAAGIEEYEAAEMLLHLTGDFSDPADVIGLLEVLLRVRPDAKATGAGGELLPVSRPR